MGETLRDRAAKHFGLFDQPRRSVDLGRATVAIFARDHLYIYDEGALLRAVHVRLTDTRREALMAELERGLAVHDG